MTESSLKINKNIFYSTLKTPFVLKILKFCLDFLVMEKNDMIGKIRVISILMTSKPRKETIATHAYPICQEIKAIRQLNLVC